MMLATKKHLEALSQNRSEILVAYGEALALLDVVANEIEVYTGDKLETTREVLADWRKRYDIEVAQ